MARQVAIGIQDFEKIITEDYFYVDKTDFIREWWESGDSVTLITRPRRFGKTLNMSMLEQFFSIKYANRADLFEKLSIWKCENYHKIQGTYPVISLSFANVKETNYKTTSYRICEIIMEQFEKYAFLQECELLSKAEREYFVNVTFGLREEDAPMALRRLSDYLYRYYGKKVIILLDEYDTPMQESYVYGFWEELVTFTRSLFNATFKTNPYLERAIMTGITRVSTPQASLGKESVFSDLNHLKVVTTTSDEYATAFGFMESEVFFALDEYGLGAEKADVKYWYDGFIFGSYADIYNPWSVLNFLDTGKYETYWANTSSNHLVGKLIREGDKRVKTTFETLLKGESVNCEIDEQIVYNQLEYNQTAIWSLLLASGYLKVLHFEKENKIAVSKYPKYELVLTNYEVLRTFSIMVRTWFFGVKSDYNDFVTALLCDNVEEMNIYMNRVTLETFSYFDIGRQPSKEEPERFYHGFVLGLMSELSEEYVLTSNRESGFGRYDVMIEPKDKNKNAIILEFKVHNAKKEATLEETVQNALKQIEEKQYEANLIARGFSKEQIRKYGFAFEGKEVLIG